MSAQESTCPTVSLFSGVLGPISLLYFIVHILWLQALRLDPRARGVPRTLRWAFGTVCVALGTALWVLTTFYTGAFSRVHQIAALAYFLLETAAVCTMAAVDARLRRCAPWELRLRYVVLACNVVGVLGFASGFIAELVLRVRPGVDADLLQHNVANVFEIWTVFTWIPFFLSFITQFEHISIAFERT